MKVCIVGLKCYDQLRNVDTPRYLGGIETQLAFLSKGLRRTGLDVSVLVFDEGQKEVELVDGIEVRKTFDPDNGIRWIRTLHPRATGIWKSMGETRADVFLQMGAGIETLEVALGCRMRSERKRFVYCVASDADVAPGSQSPLGLEHTFFRKGLTAADRVIVQSRAQEQQLTENYGKEGVIIPMAVSDPRGVTGQQPGREVLWLGRIVREKRLEFLIEVAEACPDYRFHVVGAANSSSAYSVDALARAEACPNIVAHGRVSEGELSDLFNKCNVLCNTSTMEGFPTTFLEAWSRGMPVLTTFDPDGLVERESVGWRADDVEGMVIALQGATLNENQYSDASQRSRALFLREYSEDAIMHKYVELFSQVVEAA